MQTRRDLYQAHKLMMQRVGLALLQGEPDIAESPMRRLSVSAFSGAMLAVLIAAVFGVIGLISPGGARGLDAGGSIIIEKETGTKYIYDTNHHQMVPVLNYASAKLALDTDNPPQRVVSRKSLAKFTRGQMIGIPGAPDSLPDPDHLVKKPWSVCVRQGTDAKTGSTRPITSLVAGRSVGGHSLGDDQALVVQADGDMYVIWQNQRMHVTVSANEANSVTGVTPSPVTQAWLKPIDEGPDFAPPRISGLGAARPGIGGADARVGQVYRAQSASGAAWYVLEKDGFAPITEMQGWLLLAQPMTKARAYRGRSAEPLETDTATVNKTRSSQDPIPPGFPKTKPVFRSWSGSTPLCSVYAHTDQGSTSAQVSLGGTLANPSSTPTGESLAVDQIVLPPGGAALVGTLPGPNQLNAINTWSIVNDAGIRFPLISKDTMKKLGYDIRDAAPVPQQVLSLIPTGPPLDPAKARLPVPAPRPAA